MSEVVSFYRFERQDDTEKCARRFFDPAQKRGLLGTVLIAPEGWNVTLSGDRQNIDAYLQELIDADPAGPDPSEIKRMRTDSAPFRKLIYKVKPEIIRFGREVDVNESAGTYVTAGQLHSMLRDHAEDVLMLDVRNAYEAAAGTFENALTLPIEQFSDFPDACASIDWPEDKTVVSFCTGGIRCEKAVAWLRSSGRTNVFQIEGGIWRYLEKYPQGFFKGRCFWFDEREDASTAN